MATAICSKDWQKRLLCLNYLVGSLLTNRGWPNSWPRRMRDLGYSVLRATCLLIPVPVLDPFSVGAERIGQLNMKEGINGYHFLGDRKGVCGLRQNHTCNGEHGEQHEKSPEVDIF